MFLFVNTVLVDFTLHEFAKNWALQATHTRLTSVCKSIFFGFIKN